MKVKALAVKQEQMRDKQTGRETSLWKVFVLADDGEVRYLYSADPVQPGADLELQTAVKDGRLRVKVRRQRG